MMIAVKKKIILRFFFRSLSSHILFTIINQIRNFNFLFVGIIKIDKQSKKNCFFTSSYLLMKGKQLIKHKKK
jgi:hypothetical protein